MADDFDYSGPIDTAPASAPVALPAKITQYGYKDDETPDPLTEAGWGINDSKLAPGVAALSPSMEKKLNAKPGDALQITDTNGNKRIVYFGDRTSQDLKDDRVDIYQPDGYDNAVADAQQVVNLGGGASDLNKEKLTQAGLANIAKYQTPAPAPAAALPGTVAVDDKKKSDDGFDYSSSFDVAPAAAAAAAPQPTFDYNAPFEAASAASKGTDLLSRVEQGVGNVVGSSIETGGRLLNSLNPLIRTIAEGGADFVEDKLNPGEQVQPGGKELKDKAAAIPVNPAFDADASTKAADLVGNVLPYLNPGAIPVAGLSGYQQAFDDAKAKGMNDDAANRAGLINSVTQMGVQKFVGYILPILKDTQGEQALKSYLAAPTLGQAAAQLGIGTVKIAARGAAEGVSQSVGHQLAVGDNPTSTQALGEDLESAEGNAVAAGTLHTGFGVLGRADAASQVDKMLADTNDQRTQAGQPPLTRPAFVQQLAEAQEQTTPEKPVTLQIQQEEMVNGKRDAMLFTPGTTELPVPTGFDRLKTNAGVFHYNPDELEPEEIKMAVDQGTIGDVLDYGISSKPDLTQPHTAVVRRDAQGNEIEAVATDQANLPNVLAKVGSRAEPGQTIATESPAQVIAGRTDPTDDDLLATMTAELPDSRRLETKQKLAFGLKEDQRNQNMADEQAQRLQQQSQDARASQQAQNDQDAQQRAARLQFQQEKESAAKTDTLHNASDDVVADMAHGGDADAQNELLARNDGSEFDYQMALKAAAERKDGRQQDADMQQQLEQEHRDFAGESPAQGPELLDAIRQAGGLPKADSGGLTGELAVLREDAPRGVFRPGQTKSLDRIREELGDQGFHFDTPNDLLQAVDQRLRTGKPMNGEMRTATEEQQQTRFSRVDKNPTAGEPNGDESASTTQPGDNRSRESLEAAAAGGSPEAGARLLRRSAEANARVTGTRQESPGLLASNKLLAANRARAQQSLDYNDLADRLNVLHDDEGLPEGSTLIGQGVEHQVFHRDGNQLVTKLTKPHEYGVGLIGRERPTPESYLSRLALQNQVFGDDIKWHGINGIGQTITSQPFHKAMLDKEGKTIKPTHDEVAAKMREEGFAPTGTYGEWYNAKDKVVVRDAHPRNFIKDVLGRVHPIDLQIAVATPEQQQELGTRFSREHRGAPAFVEPVKSEDITQLARQDTTALPDFWSERAHVLSREEAAKQLEKVGRPEDAEAMRRGLIQEFYLPKSRRAILVPENMSGIEQARGIVREVATHDILNHPEMQAELRRFFDEHLRPEDIAAFTRRGYVQQPGESSNAWRARLADEWIAQNSSRNTTLWQKLVAWIQHAAKKLFGKNLNRHDIGSAMIDRAARFHRGETENGAQVKGERGAQFVVGHPSFRRLLNTIRENFSMSDEQAEQMTPTIRSATPERLHQLPFASDDAGIDPRNNELFLSPDMIQRVLGDQLDTKDVRDVAQMLLINARTRAGVKTGNSPMVDTFMKQMPRGTAEPLDKFERTVRLSTEPEAYEPNQVPPAQADRPYQNHWGTIRLDRGIRGAVAQEAEAGARKVADQFKETANDDADPVQRLAEATESNIEKREPVESTDEEPAPVDADATARVADLLRRGRDIGQSSFVFNDAKGRTAKIYLGAQDRATVHLPKAWLFSEPKQSFGDLREAVEHLIDSGFELQSSTLEKKLAKESMVQRFVRLINQGMKIGQRKFVFSHEDGRMGSLNARKDGTFSASGLGDLVKFKTHEAATRYLHNRGFELMSSALEKKLRTKGLHPDQAQEPFAEDRVMYSRDADEFGPEKDFTGKPQEAVQWLLQHKTGVADGALFHPEVGPIALLYGIEGASRGKGAGLAKLLKWHPEIDVNNLQKMLDGMHSYNENDNTVWLAGDGYEAIIRRNIHGAPKEWLLTAFQKYKTASTHQTMDRASDGGLSGQALSDRSGEGNISPDSQSGQPRYSRDEPVDYRNSLEKLSDLAEQLRHVRADIQAGAGRTLGDKLQVKEARLTELRTKILAEVQSDLARGKFSPDEVRAADSTAAREINHGNEADEEPQADQPSRAEPMHQTSTPEGYEAKIKAFEGDTLKGEPAFSKWFGHITGWVKGFMRVPELAGLPSNKKAMFLEGLSRLRQATTWVQQQAAEKVGHVVDPLSAIKDKEAFHAAYDLFRKKVAYSDLYFRSKIEAGGIGPDGQPRKVVLPYKMTQSDVGKRLMEIQHEIDTNQNKPAITEAIKRHYALVEDVRTDLENRGMPMPEHLQNPFYFPHKILEFWDGNVAQVAKRIRGDFRGYLIDPVGSVKGIETDYVKAMYAHMAEVLAHNERADIVQRYWIDPYDRMDDAKLQFREDVKANPSLNWEEWLQQHYPDYSSMVADPNLPLRWETVISPEAITETLGKDFTTTKDWQNRLQAMGIKITPEMVREILTVSAGKDRFLVPKQVKDAVQGVLRRDQQAQDVGLLEKGVGPFLTLWKQTVLNAPWNLVRYQYGNLIADTEKILTRDTRMAGYIPQAVKEIREFYKTNTPGTNDNLREALKRGVLQSVSMSELHGGPGLLSWFKSTENVKDWGTLPELKQFEQFANRQQEFWKFVAEKKLNPFWWSQDLSEIRESSFRYAKFLADLDRIKSGAEPEYAGALRSEVRALSDPYDQAAKVARDTFVDYNMISPNGDGLRRHLIPFYSWMEGNFRYHINLFRNMGDMASQGEFFRSMKTGLPLASGAVGLAARLAIPWLAVQLWNNRDDEARKMEGDLSDADRRKFHITLGRDEKTGEVKVIYTNTALADFVDWFSGQEAAGRLIDMMAGRSTFEQAIKDFHLVAAKNAVNKVVQGIGPALKIPLTAAIGRNTFPDVFDSRAIPAYDMRHAVLSEFDGTVADVLEGIVNKDFYAPKDFAGWAEQALLQVRRRDPAQWAYFGVKQEVDDWMQTKGLSGLNGTDNRTDAQVKANFRRAIYKGDIPGAIQYYNRLLDLGYTSERFTDMVQNQDPLGDLPKNMRQEYVDGLSDYDQVQLLKAYEYTARLREPNSSQQRQLGLQLFPSQKASPAAAERFRDDPRHELLLENELDRRSNNDNDDLEEVAQHLMNTSLKPAHR